VIRAALVLLLAAAGAAAGAEGVTVALRDVGRIDGARQNPMVGYGLVTGLAGTGDSARNRATRQSLSNMLAQFGLNVPLDQLQSRNVAAVMVTAALPAFARPGDRVDVTVASIGDAKSLLGGTLLLTPLRGADSQVRALAQGALAVGGYQYDLNGNLQQKNHPTVAAVPLGGTIEKGVRSEVLSSAGTLRFVLAEPDYAMASRVAAAINAALGVGTASARDAAAVEIRAPAGAAPHEVVGMLSRIETLTVAALQRARVVINERTGTVVSGGDVRLSAVTIAHGEVKVSIVTENTVSQPFLVRQTGPDVRTVVVPNTRITVAEPGTQALSLAGASTVADLVSALARLRTPTRDVISILQSIKAAGALHAELVIQ
jgi:flagellar P-ring protein precursor FlgI